MAVAHGTFTPRPHSAGPKVKENLKDVFIALFQTPTFPEREHTSVAAPFFKMWPVSHKAIAPACLFRMCLKCGTSG